MFSHVMVGSNDIDRSKKFYDATFAARGGQPGRQDDKGRLMYLHNGGIFMVTPPIDGKPATHGNGCTIGFAMTPDQADAWHSAGVANGGMAIEDPPFFEAFGDAIAKSCTASETPCSTVIATVSSGAVSVGFSAVYFHPSHAKPLTRFASLVTTTASASAPPHT